MAQTLLHIVLILLGVSFPTGVAIYILKGLANRVSAGVDAYATESAKIKAQFLNLDKLVEQTHRLTVVTESIKDEVWDRQARWTAKREMYIRLLEVIGQFINDQQGEQSVIRLRAQVGDIPDLQKRLEASGDALEATMTKGHRIVDVAPLVISPEAFSLMVTVIGGAKDIPATIPGPQDSMAYTICEANILHLKKCREQMWNIERADLGFPAVQSSKGTLDA